MRLLSTCCFTLCRSAKLFVVIMVLCTMRPVRWATVVKQVHATTSTSTLLALLPSS